MADSATSDWLRERGAHRFDAAGWHYLETLARRAEAHEGSARRMLEEKLARAVAAFSERFVQARTAAEALVSIACQKHPPAAPELQALLVLGDIKGLRHLCAQLDAREHALGLAGLVAQLEPALASMPGQAAVHPASTNVTAIPAPPLELKTVRESRATWAKLSVDRQLALAMKQAPVNAGPINSHMLVLRSLAMMQDISPDYLSRLVSYFDTLLSLDPGGKDVPPIRKKAAPAKLAKTTRAIKK
jgi:hypothetical protein